MIKFTRQSVRPDGEVLYRLEKDGEVLREGITLDEVIYAINRMDEERAGLHGPVILRNEATKNLKDPSLTLRMTTEGKDPSLTLRMTTEGKDPSTPLRSAQDDRKVDPSGAPRQLPFAKGSQGQRPGHTADREPEVRRGRGG